MISKCGIFICGGSIVYPLASEASGQHAYFPLLDISVLFT